MANIVFENPCCTYPCIQQLEQFVGAVNFLTLLDKGIIEESTVNGTGIICELLAFVDDNNISVSDTMSIISVLLDKGFVANCGGGTTIIASIETYLKYAEAVGLTESAPVPA